MINDSPIKSTSSSAKKLELTNFSSGINTLADETVLPLKYAKCVYNFDFSKGVLKEGKGIDFFDSLPDGQTAVAMFLYKRYDYNEQRYDNRILYFCAGGDVYYRSADRLEPLQKLEGIRLNGIPMAANYRLFSQDVVLICSQSDKMIVWDGESAPYSIENSPYISSMTLHYERMFATVTGDKTAVWFSDDLDPTNWEISLSEGGFIELVDQRGVSNKVISFLNYIFVFRENGISRITAYAGQSEFSVSHLFVSGGRIYTDTICLCGDRVIFLAEDGLYAFDGMSVHRVLSQLDGLYAKSTGATAAYCGGKYFVALRLNFDDDKMGVENNEDFQNNALLCYDIASGCVDIMRGYDICALSSIAFEQGETLLCSLRFDNRIGKICDLGTVFGEPTQKCWQTPYTDLGLSGQEKIIRKILLRSKYPCKLEIYSEKAAKTINIAGGNAICEAAVNIRGKLIGFKIKSDCELAHISKPVLVLNVR